MAGKTKQTLPHLVPYEVLQREPAVSWGWSHELLLNLYTNERITYTI